MVSKIIISLFIIAVIMFVNTSGVSIAKRSNDSSNESVKESTERRDLCQGRTPCGWAVYNRFSRYLEYFMRNRCVCSAVQKCLREEDDISITAYVYRCKVPPSETSTTKSTS